MKLHSCFNFGGNCAEAFRFYAEHLGGLIGMMTTHDQAPIPARTQQKAFNMRASPLAIRPLWQATCHPALSADLQRLSFAQRRRQERSRVDLPSAHRRRRNFHAYAGNVLRTSLRTVPRSLRRVLDDSAREADGATGIKIIRRGIVRRALCARVEADRPCRA